MFINRTSFKNLKTTWRPSLKTMVEKRLNSLNFLKKASWLTIWKKLEQFIATSFTLKKASHNGFVSTCIAFGKKNVEKTANTWRKLKLSFGLICLHTFVWAQVKKTQIGDQTSFWIKISAKTSLTPNYFLS